jgi:hypothetical protein
LEKDIQKLSKNYIFVDTTQPSTFAWLYNWYIQI